MTTSTGSATVSSPPQPLLNESEALPVSLPAPPPLSPLRGNPAVFGLPTVIAGAFGLGLVDTGWLPPAAAGAALPIILTSAAVGLLVAAIWAAALGQNPLASLFAVFFGFYGSYAAFGLGLGHNWYNIPATQITRTTELWLISWLVTLVLVTVATLRLPSSFTLLLGFADGALLLLLLGTINTSTALTHAGGYLVFGFTAVAAYLYLAVMSAETGGKGLPLGKPVISG
ncbi:GPR1/FUN34/YaaH family transporter [Frankia sp. BMG5.23]|uniref:GPR1/FUN34/YaaH family transporter n=1 Tax=Frankia sp. BMG5.23 TaxID=683305 RepID=UPI0004610870|nr:GPR1/FUN34/YaaH family transporter [Frankia sp. BMG5.23]KDA41121.1 putative membrane protein [Frankia sp. BMG5.23]